MEATWNAISALPPAVLLQRSALAYLLLNAAHIASLGLLIGTVITLDIRLIGGFQAVSLRSAWSLLTRTAAVGLALAMLSGVILFSVNAPHYAHNTAFQIKLLLISTALANALSLHARARRLVHHAGHPSTSMKVQAALSIALWLSVIVAGRWIGFL